jgi:hypothetical protein
METYGGSGGAAAPFLTSALDGGEWSVSRPGRFTPGINHPLYLFDKRLGAAVKKSLAPAGNRTRTVAVPTELAWPM